MIRKLYKPSVALASSSLLMVSVRAEQDWTVPSLQVHRDALPHLHAACRVYAWHGAAASHLLRAVHGVLRDVKDAMRAAAEAQCGAFAPTAVEGSRDCSSDGNNDPELTCCAMSVDRSGGDTARSPAAAPAAPRGGVLARQIEQLSATLHERAVTLHRDHALVDEALCALCAAFAAAGRFAERDATLRSFARSCSEPLQVG